MPNIQSPTAPFLDAVSGIESSLKQDYGYLIGGPGLWRTMGYPTYVAFVRAQERGALRQLPLFKIPRRRGVFCLTNDVATYLAKAKLGLLESSEGEESSNVR